MGLSMDTQNAVNDVVCDRIVLTVTISACAILFTWAVALPTGVFSSVRQYSMGDYMLNLPPEGALLLRALQIENIYLAGSMLLMLSLLGIIGTLVSDLLLLVLDPRIRMEQAGTK